MLEFVEDIDGFVVKKHENIFGYQVFFKKSPEGIFRCTTKTFYFDRKNNFQNKNPKRENRQF